MSQYALGPFVLDADRMVLLRNEREVDLQPRVVELLSYLAAHRGRVVTKEELVETVWCGAFVTDAAIKKAVHEARSALGDDGERQRYIQTVHGRGYRLAPGVTSLPADPEAGQASEPVVSIAVLPFLDFGPDQEGELYALGITEELIHALTQLPRLRVASRTSAFRFRETGLDVRQVGRELQVAAVVEGSVRKAGDRLRVTAQLVEVTDGFHLWSQSYDRRISDVFDVQDEVARAIAGTLDRSLGDRPLAGRRLPEAHSAAALVRFYYDLDRPAAEACYRRAIELNPGDATLHAWYAIFLASFQDRFEEAQERAELALRLDPVSLEANLFAAGATGFPRDLAVTRERLMRLIELYPAFPHGHAYLAWCLVPMGEPDEAVAAAERGRELGPGDPVCEATAAWALGELGEVAAARERLRALTARRQVGYFPALFLAWAAAGLRQADQALAWIEEARAERAPWLVFMHHHPMFDSLREDRRFRGILEQVAAGNWASV